MLIVTPTKGKPGQPCGQASRGTYRRCREVCGTSDLGIGWGYVRQLEIVVMTARVIGWCLGLSEGQSG
jgi:hypothetical protein